MNLPEAIESLFSLAHEDIALEHPGYKDALKLGIEALKRIIECRLADHTIKEDLLPGETKE